MVCAKAQKALKEGTPRLTQFEWGDCGTIPDESWKVGRPRAKKLTHPRVHYLPEGNSTQNTSLDLTARETLSKHPSVDKHLKCQLCSLILDRPLQLTT
ncbi:MAG: hypothetical protein A6F71_10435 [Cycloclasticus sp. symbiont of Poecilosclerida sp. M]|nr:MAG: hypothetical protein A6F71_10435 [Cycloclasticus sp. symbiont of Poecilosclerida sp. M]